MNERISEASLERKNLNLMECRTFSSHSFISNPPVFNSPFVFDFLFPFQKLYYICNRPPYTRPLYRHQHTELATKDKGEFGLFHYITWYLRYACQGQEPGTGLSRNIHNFFKDIIFCLAAIKVRLFHLFFVLHIFCMVRNVWSF